MSIKFNKNIFWNILLLLLYPLLLKSYGVQLGNLYGIMIVFIIFIAIPAGFVFTKNSTLFLSQSIGILPFIFWYKTHNPFIIKTPLFILFLTIGLLQIIFEKRKISFNIIDIVFFSPILIFLISLFLHSFPNRLMEFTFFYCGLYTIYFLFRQVKQEKKKLIHFWIYIGTFIAMYGILQWLGGDPFNPMTRFQKAFSVRIIGTLGNPNFFSGYLIGILAFTLYYFTKKPGKILGVALLLQLIAIIATGTRGVLIALLITIIIFALIKKSKLLIATFTFLVILSFIIPSLRTRMLSIPQQFSKKTGSLGQRILMWKTAVNMIKRNPFGMGLAGFRLNYPEYQGQYLKDPHLLNLATHARHPHDEFFEMALVGGPILLFLYILLFIFLIRLLFIKKENIIFQGALFAILTMLIHNLASVVLNYSPPLSNFAILFGIIVIALKTDNKFHFSSKILYVLIVFNIFLFIFWTRVTLGSYHFANGIGWMNAYNNHKDIRYLEKSKSELLMSLRFDPSFVNTWYRLGNVYLLMDKALPQVSYEKEALKYLEKANMLKPHYFEIRYNMGLTYLMKRNYKRADLLFEKAMELEPYKLTVVKEWCESGYKLLKNSDKYKKRLDYLKKAIESNELSLQYNPNSSTIISDIRSVKNYYYRQTGFYFFQKKDLNKALTMFDSGFLYAKKINDKNEVKLFLNNCLAISRQLKNIGLIKKYILLLREEFPNSANIYYEEALFQLQYGSKDQGINMLNRLLDGKPEKRTEFAIYKRLILLKQFDVFKKLHTDKRVKDLTAHLAKNENRKILEKKYPDLKELLQ